MEAWKKRLIIVHHCPHLTALSCRKLIQYDPLLEKLFHLSPNQLSHILSISINASRKAIEYLSTFQIDNLLNAYQKRNIEIITLQDSLYPAFLKEIYDPPLVLYIKGNSSLLKTRKLGVVGARVMTKYGVDVLGEIVPPLVREGFTIVSGLAKGVDALSHQLAMENQGNTIAVLGSGIERIYPHENKSLAEELSKEQLLISEYPPFTPPKKWFFPERNRIISGLSEGVIIIEAKEKSGSLITADQALEQGREVFAIPGSILAETSVGTNHLIQQGAKLVLNPQDILVELL